MVQDIVNMYWFRYVRIDEVGDSIYQYSSRGGEFCGVALGDSDSWNEDFVYRETVFTCRHDPVQLRSGKISKALVVNADGRERGLGIVTDDFIVVNSKDRHFVWDSDLLLTTGVQYVLGAKIVRGEQG